MIRRLTPLCSLLLLALAVAAGNAQTRRMVIIDQDGAGPGGTDQMSMMVLLQSPQADVLGITIVTGDAWEPEEVQHTLRMLELIHRTDVPVVPGAIFPLVRTEETTKIQQALYGGYRWYGAWGDLLPNAGRKPYHGPYVVPKLIEGEPSTKPLAEDAAHFMIRQVRAHPHQVTIYAAGPLTNIALAISHRSALCRAYPGHRHHGRQSESSDRRSGVRQQSAARVQLLVRPGGSAHHASRALAAHRPHDGRYLRQDRGYQGDAR